MALQGVCRHGLLRIPHLTARRKARFVTLNTMTFIDVAEMAKMQSQSWFQSFTDTLKRGGKLSLNLPFIKYEQTAAPKSFSDQDALTLQNKSSRRYKRT